MKETVSVIGTLMASQASADTDASDCAPETMDMVRSLAAMGQQTPQWLTRALYQALFGTPDAATDTIRFWCRSMQRAQLHDCLAPLLVFLATAPAVPCLQHHVVGGRERHAVFFLPFGDNGRLAQTLKIPLAVTDVRVTRAVQLLAVNPWAFTQMKHDPVFGFITYTNFAYTAEAQKKLDYCRPTLLAAAMRAIVMQLRLDIFYATSSSSAARGGVPAGVLPRARLEQAVLSRPPTYTQAMVESDILAALKDRLRELQQRRASGYHSAAQKQLDMLAFGLIKDAINFVLLERVGQVKSPVPGSGSSSTMQDTRYPFAILPDDQQILVFAGETTKNWNHSLTQARAVLPVSYP